MSFTAYTGAWHCALPHPELNPLPYYYVHIHTSFSLMFSFIQVLLPILRVLCSFCFTKPLCGTNALWALPWLTQLVCYFSKRRPKFDARPMQVGFMASKLSLPEAFLSAPRFSSESELPATLHYYSFTHPRGYTVLAIDSVVK
jgi:hypothetical protein